MTKFGDIPVIKTNSNNITGDINNPAIPVTYTGGKTDTADVYIDRANVITVNVKDAGKSTQYVSELALNKEEGVLSGINVEGSEITNVDLGDLNTAKGIWFDEEKDMGTENPYYYLTSKVTDDGEGGLTGDPGERVSEIWPYYENIISGPYNLGKGGGGGGGSTEVELSPIDWPTTITLGASCPITIIWASYKKGQPTTNNGTVSIIVNGKQVIKKSCPQGENNFEIGKYLVSGDNTVQVKVVDAYNTEETIIQNIATVAIELTSKFDYTRAYTGTIAYTYIPIGNVEKTVHFEVDGVKIGTQVVKSSGEQQTYRFSNLSHGAHTLKVYFVVNIDGEDVRSNELFYELIYYTSGDRTPIIASQFRDFEQLQYQQFQIPYRVYTPGKNKSEVELYVAGTLEKTLSVNTTEQFWEHRSGIPGKYTLTIKTGTIERTFDIEIKESEIKIEPVKEELVLALSAYGRSNSEEHPEIWNDTEHGVTCELKDFSFPKDGTSDGWVRDAEGNTVLRIAGGASVIVNYKPFAEVSGAITTTGKTIELEFATSMVRNYETMLIDCFDTDNRGFYLTPQLAKLKSQQAEIQTQYKEDDHVRVAFVIEKQADNRLIYMYINGVISGIVQYPEGDVFRQLEPINIVIGSSEANIDIYNIRVYDNNLTRKQVVQNWIADTQNGELKSERYLHNDNFNEMDELVIAKLPTDLPYMVWDIDPLPQYKGDKRNGNATFVDPVNSDRSYTIEDLDGAYNVQGTSSAVYPVKNIRLKSKKYHYTNTGEIGKDFLITEGGIPANYFTYKVDFASSEGCNNVELVRLYNELTRTFGILTPPQKQDERVRVGIDGFPIVAFHQDKNGVIKFNTKANFNNDKANEDVYGFEADLDPDTEAWLDGDESWETTNNSAYEGLYKKAITQETFANSFEIRFPDEDGFDNITRLKAMSDWVVSTNREEATGNAIEPISFTYKTVERSEDGTYSEKTVTVGPFTADTVEYRLAKFRAEFENHFNVNSSILYYLFTHLFLMVDSRAKNAFPTYYRSREEGDGGDRWFWLPYDMDTALGINNEGKLVFDYSLEDTDKIDGANVFNGQDSVLWCNLRDTFDGEIGKLYSEMRTTGSPLSFENVEKMFTEHQAKWSENILNEDTYTKYVVPLLEKGDNYLEMAQGIKAEQRRWWLYNRFKYFDSKYIAGEAKDDYILFRAYAKSDIDITPYADIYACVSFANAASAVVSVRAKRGETYTLHNPLPDSASDQETHIYSASQLKSVGDLSGFLPDTVKVANAIKLQDLKVGDSAEGYTNPHLTELTLGENTLLKSLDARNCINLKQKISLKACTNIEEIYLTGTQVPGVQLPVGGVVKHLHLPGTITDLTIRSHKQLEDLYLAEPYTYIDERGEEKTIKIESLWLEDIPAATMAALDVDKIIKEHMKETGAQVRLIGIDTTFSSANEIKEFYKLLDTMSGKTAEGDPTDYAQVEGVIHIDEISYADYIALTNWATEVDPTVRYQEVRIDAKEIICTVTFRNEGEQYDTVNVRQGEFIEKQIPDPTKESSISTDYTFTCWLYADSEKVWQPDDIILKDEIINASYTESVRQYTVYFDKNWSEAHWVEGFDPEVKVDYDTLVPDYSDKLSWDDEAVTLAGWYSNNEPFDFTTKISADLILTAHWQDSKIPVATISRKNYHEFTATGSDNIGITHYCLKVNTEEEPEVNEWQSVEYIAREFSRDYAINSAGTYKFWVKDANNNIANAKIIAYPISVEHTTGIEIENIHIVESDVGTITDFALNGTSIIVTATTDSHYENLGAQINGKDYELGTEYTVNDETKIILTCTPKSYMVQFNNKDEGYKPEDATVIFDNLVPKPAEQYTLGRYITGWYTTDDLAIAWNFDEDTVSEDMILFAKWEDYNSPTEITIEIPEDDTKEIEVDYQQTVAETVSIDWGDGSAIEKSDVTGDIIKLTHPYASAGEYTIKIYGTSKGYDIGNSAERQVVNPSRYITKVKLAWDLSKLHTYLFRYARNLTEIEIPRFITEISSGAFASTGLKSVVIPDSVTALGSAVFSDCKNLSSVKFSKNMSTIESITFDQDTSLTSLEIPANIKEIRQEAFRGSGLTDIDILYEGTEKAPLKIGQSVFNTCSNLEHVRYRSEYVEFTSATYDYCPNILTAGPISDCSIKEAPYNIEFAWTDEIPDWAFYYGWASARDNVYFKQVTMPASITRIGYNAFTNTKLEKINIVGMPEDNILPPNLLEIGAQAFARTNLPAISIPSAVNKIGDLAFSQMSTNLKDIDIYTKYIEEDSKAYEINKAWFLGLAEDTSGADPRIRLHNWEHSTTTEETINEAFGVYWNLIKIEDKEETYASYSIV